METTGFRIIENWFRDKGIKPFPFQRETWEACLAGRQGLVNAPTGSGKSFALWYPSLIEWINEHPDEYQQKISSGLRLIWVTPLRALAKDLQFAFQETLEELNIPWEVGRRTGDVSYSVKQKQNKRMPEVLIITPESLHVLFTQKNYERHFSNLRRVVVDEWHELIGTKRGTQTELALNRLKHIQPDLQTWGVSATIGNLDEALEVLLGDDFKKGESEVIRASVDKKIEVHSILPNEIENFPWYGHLGINLLNKVLPIIDRSRSCLIFTNTRGQAELWFQEILLAKPELAGVIALHHGSLNRDVREWVENSLSEGKLKAVVCTSSLDLGVDFSPVETVIQVGSPKGVARFLQRAGRSGHKPGQTSVIYFLPTHALELIEAAALKTAIKTTDLESRPPILKPYDVMIQYMITLAVSDGFDEESLFREVTRTFAYQTLSRDEWLKMLDFITTGGNSLKRYDEYNKVVIEDGLYKVTDRRTAQRHKLNIGTISSDSMMRVKYLSGASIGVIEERFITQLNIGDKFWFGGRTLELIKIAGMIAYVKRVKATKAKTPSWQGGRMSLSSNMTKILRDKMQEYVSGERNEIEFKTIEPILDIQENWSTLPGKDDLLIEKTYSREGCHVFFYPFEGRYVHEGLAALFAYRISKLRPFSFSIAMNDYGFELLSDQDIPIEKALKNDLFSQKNLIEDITSSLNHTELAKSKFWGISQVAGLIFNGFPGEQRKTKHLQMSSSLLFDVFNEFDPQNLLLQQSYDEVLFFQLDEIRLRKALNTIANQKVILNFPERFTPYAFPIMVDRLREKLTNEKLIDRIRRMQTQLEKHL
jgi:ATP-dependent Lhr-like helicase